MKRVRAKVNNIPDFKDKFGSWARSYSPDPSIRYHTRADVLWGNITSRCKTGGAYQDKNPTYSKVINRFKDFQEFAEWCQTQYGYLNKEQNGYFWQLDKDLKGYGSKAYSPDTCIFVPSRVNALLLSNAASRGEYKLGVWWHKTGKKFCSNCTNGVGKTKHLGMFLTEHEAHKAWQKYKVELIRKICVEDEEIRNHLELVPILLAQAQRIEDDLLNNRETT